MTHFQEDQIALAAAHARTKVRGDCLADLIALVDTDNWDAIKAELPRLVERARKILAPKKGP